MPKRRRPSRRRTTQYSESQSIHAGSLKQLRRAHKMMEIGQHKDSAQIFEGLARKAEDLGRLRVAPNLYFQAARSNLLAGESKIGGQLLSHGLEILAKKERWPALARASRRIIQELEQLGYPEISENISGWSDKILPDPIEHFLPSPQIDLVLPVKCPACSGVLHPGDLEMLDEANAECPFCGTTLKGQ